MSGTGKTLIARKIGKMLNGREPKLVKGPEILSKFVGESEENIRKLFADAEAEYKAKGEGSGLHVIIFDEIDAICKARGTVSNGTGVNDSVVNQLLSQIDGVDSLNNMLLIGMTNRLDMIDEALLRPGRFELKLMIGLPDEDGRRQIFDIHTKRMRENSLLAPDVDTAALAARCKNFSGAEIAGLVRAAVSRATEHCIKLSGGVHVDVAAARDIRLTMRDFEQALGEVRPAFGADDDQIERHCINGIVSWDMLADAVLDVGRLLVQQVAHSVRSPLVSLLVEGEAGAGKSALACEVTRRSEFPFVKLVSAEKMIGLSEAGKLAVIAKTFDDAHKSELACIVVDDIERIVEWVPIGARFSNHLLQALLVLLKKTPPAGHRLLVICTTSCMPVLREMGMTAVFTKVAHVPLIERADQLEPILETSLDAATITQVMASVDANTICHQNGNRRLRIGVKKVFSFMDMARQADNVAETLLGSLYDECCANHRELS
jgi:vesicle-fusing ATPase